MNEAEKVNAICFWLIKTLCIDTNADSARIEQKGFHDKTKVYGDYEIIVRKLGAK